jgi:hypothetical protein
MTQISDIAKELASKMNNSYHITTGTKAHNFDNPHKKELNMLDSNTSVQFVRKINHSEIEDDTEIQEVKPVVLSKPMNIPAIKTTVKSNSEIPVQLQKQQVVDITSYKNISKDVISRVANLIKYHIIEEELFYEVRDFFTGKDINITLEAFNKELGNCIYHSLINFIGLERNAEGEPLSLVVDKDADNYPSIVFLNRIYHNQIFSNIQNPKIVLGKYDEAYNDEYNGIQIEWLQYLNNKISKKFMIKNEGIDVIDDFIGNNWCYIEDTSNQLFDNEQPKESNLSFKNVEEDDEIDSNEGLSADVYTEGDYIIAVICPLGEIKCNGKEIPIAIPFYLNKKDINIDQIETIDSVIDKENRNGDWEFLVNFKPQMIFITQDPENYLYGNDDNTSSVKTVILNKNASGYAMGCYEVDVELGKLKNRDKKLKILNYIIQNNILTSNISHLDRSLSMKHLYKPEEEILAKAAEMDTEEDEIDNDEESCLQEQNEIIDEDIDSQSRTAIEALTGDLRHEDHLHEEETTIILDNNDNIPKINSEPQAVSKEKENIKKDEQELIPVRTSKVDTIDREAEEERFYQTRGRGR